jgi:hypothetical protein
MAGNVERLKPFEANYARSIVGLAQPDLLYALPKSADERVRRRLRIGRNADAPDVIHYVGERVWIERNDVRLKRQSCRSTDDFVVVESANIAKTLGYNEFRRACPQRLFVDQVESFACFQKLPDFAIDLLARKTMAIDGTPHHDGFLLCIGRIIALMSDADDLIAKTERKRDFRRTGE